MTLSNIQITDRGSLASPLGVPGRNVSELPVPRQIEARDLDRLRRYREYLDYYEGRRGAPPANRRERVLSFNYARAIVEKGASYLVSEHRPVVLPVDDSVEARRAAQASERALQQCLGGQRPRLPRPGNRDRHRRPR